MSKVSTNMANRKQRVRTLEQLPGGRCALCKDWKPTYTELDGKPLGKSESHPGVCPVCGYSPMRLRVVYVDADGAKGR